jgi:hypothetical protein
MDHLRDFDPGLCPDIANDQSYPAQRIREVHETVTGSSCLVTVCFEFVEVTPIGSLRPTPGSGG